VWVGFDDGRSLGHGEAGARTALPLWLDFMVKAMAGRPVRDFGQPPGVVVVQIDPATGLLPAPGAEGISEVFSTAPHRKKTRLRLASRPIRIRCCWKENE